MDQTKSDIDSKIIVLGSSYRFPSPYPVSTIWHHPSSYFSHALSSPNVSGCEEGELAIFDRKIANLVYAK